MQKGGCSTKGSDKTPKKAKPLTFHKRQAMSFNSNCRFQWADSISNLRLLIQVAARPVSEQLNHLADIGLRQHDGRDWSLAIKQAG
jgi:hypothetical protein